MSDTKISALPVAAVLTGSELAPLVQSAASVQATLQTILALLATLGVKNLAIGPPTPGAVALTVNANGANAANFVGSSGAISVDTTGAQISFSNNGFNYITTVGAAATLQIQASGASGNIILGTNGVNRAQIDSAGLVTVTGRLGINNNAPPAQSTGWGTPTGASVQANYAGASATLPQTSAAVAQIITLLKAFGLLGT